MRIPVELHGNGRFLFRRRDFVPAYLKTHEAEGMKDLSEGTTLF